MNVCIHNAKLLTGISEMEDSALIMEGGTVTEILSESRFQKRTFANYHVLDAGGLYVAPALIDTHIHGFKGYGTDKCSAEAILQMSIDLAQYGVGAFHPTLYPSSEEEMIYNIRQVVAAMGREEGAKIMGLHLEGPFISPQKLGVQRPETLHGVNMELMERLWQASGGHIVNMTVAPELKGMRHLALECMRKGIVLQAGHTDAMYENMVEGMQAGIFHATHMFNAMSQLHHRNPGAVGAILIHEEMSAEIIADGVHIHPDIFRLLKRTKGSDKLVLVTDALSPTEVRTGEKLFANGEEVAWKEGCFRRVKDSVIAGSGLTMKKGVKNLVSFGFSINEAVKCATANPSRIMKYKNRGLLIPGYAASLIAFDEEFHLKLVMVDGKILKEEL